MYIKSNQEMDSLMSETKFDLYLLEEADFVCISLALFFLRGQALDWSLTPLSLKAKARIKNMSSIYCNYVLKIILQKTKVERVGSKTLRTDFCYWEQSSKWSNQACKFDLQARLSICLVSKVKSAYKAIVPHKPGAYPSFYSIKQLEYFYSPWMGC